MGHSMPALTMLLAALALPLFAQGGRGADAVATEAMAVLRLGPLSRAPGESTDIRPGAPESFPEELLPRGAVIEVSSVSASLTVVVATIPADPPLDRIRFGWALEDAGWIATTSAGATFSTAAFQAPMQHCRN